MVFHHEFAMLVNIGLMVMKQLSLDEDHMKFMGVSEN